MPFERSSSKRRIKDKQASTIMDSNNDAADDAADDQGSNIATTTSVVFVDASSLDDSESLEAKGDDDLIERFDSDADKEPSAADLVTAAVDSASDPEQRGNGGGSAATSSAAMAGTSAFSSIHSPQPRQQEQALAPVLSVSSYSDLILTSESRRGIYECDYCHSDVSQLPRFRCSVCVDFDLCLDCFLSTRNAHATVTTTVAPSTSIASSSTIQHSPRMHGYRVCDCTRYPMFAATISTTTVAASVSNNNPSHGDGATTGTPSALVTGAIDATASAATAGAASPGSEDDKMEGVVTASAAASENTTNAAATSQALTMSTDEERVNLDETSNDKEPTMPQQHPILARAVSRQSSSVSVTDAVATAMGMTSTITSTSAHGGSIGESFVVTDQKAIWTIEEDLRLLEGIRKHGLGNWSDIAEAVSGQGSVSKTPKRCMERYLDGYLGRYGCILPPMALEIVSSAIEQDAKQYSAMGQQQDEANEEKESESEMTMENQEKRSSKRRASLMRSLSGASSMSSKRRFRTVPTESLGRLKHLDPYLPNKEVQIGQEVGREQAYKAEQLFVKTIAALVNVEDVERVRKEWEARVGTPGGPTVLPMRVEDLATLPGAAILGFMPRRCDFDVEYENEAEQVVADMEFISGEPVADRELKLKVLAIYNSKLDEREKRKQYVLNRGLYDYRKNQMEEQKLPRDERDLLHRMRLFERFHTPDEHKQFLADLLKAKRLRKEITKLQTYRRLGIRTLVEAEQYEVYKSRRAFHASASLQKEAEAAKSLTDEKGGSTDGGGRASTENESSYWKQYRTTQRKERLSITRTVHGTDSEPGSNPGPLGVVVDDAMIVAPETESQPAIDETKRSEDDNLMEAEAATTESVVVDMPASVLPGTELLTHREVDLCRKLELTPMQYQEIKQALLLESLSNGLLDKDVASSSKRTLVKIDVERRGKVLDFMVTAGWISLNVTE